MKIERTGVVIKEWQQCVTNGKHWIKIKHDWGNEDIFVGFGTLDEFTNNLQLRKKVKITIETID